MSSKSFKLFVFFLLIPLFSFAHQPRIVSNIENITLISNPDVSQAFYGELNNSPAFFTFEIEKEQEFYFALLVPDLPEINKNISANLFWEQDGAREVMKSLKGEDFSWQPYFEEFARDNYFKGPESKINLPPGKYFIEVLNPENTGKYVLVTGEKESFPVSEIVKTFYTLPLLKKDFFNKTYIDGFLNVFGLGLLLFVFLIILIKFSVSKLIKREIK